MFNDQHALSLVCAMAIAFFALSPALQANGDDLNALALVSGEPIPAGTEGGLGPLAPVITQNPVGSAFVFGSEEPDLFVIGRGWYRTKRGRFSHLYLFPWVATATSGAPVFGVPIQVKTEFFGPGTVFQTDDNVIHGVWLSGSVLVHTVYDVEKHSFSETERVSLPKLPRSPSEVAVLPNPDGSVEILLGIGDGVVSRPTDFPDRDPRYQPYDGAGIWRGGFPYRSLYAVSLPGLLKGPAESPRQVSQTKKDVRNTYSSLTAVNLGPEHERDIVTGSRYGGLHYYHNNISTGAQFEPRRLIARADGNAHRHPIIDPGPVAYRNSKTGRSDLIAGGEGALFIYRFMNTFTKRGNPIYADPVPVLTQNADLYGGSLPVPTVADWDGDGDMDIVSGNSDGLVLFLENKGNNKRPAFEMGVPLLAGGRVIHIQPGYRMDI